MRFWSSLRSRLTQNGHLRDWHGMLIACFQPRQSRKRHWRQKKLSGFCEPEGRDQAPGDVGQPHVESILDEIEMDWQENMGRILPACPDLNHRPWAEALMYGVQLVARTVWCDLPEVSLPKCNLPCKSWAVIFLFCGPALLSGYLSGHGLTHTFYGANHRPLLRPGTSFRSGAAQAGCP